MHVDMHDKTTTGSGKLCQARTKAGKPCSSHAQTGSEFCFMHDPAKAAERKAAQRKGGHARHGRRNVRTFDDMRPPTQIRTVDDVMALLEKTVHDLLALENSINRARAIVSLATAALKALEVGEYETRLTALEKKTNEANN